MLQEYLFCTDRIPSEFLDIFGTLLFHEFHFKLVVKQSFKAWLRALSVLKQVGLQRTSRKEIDLKMFLFIDISADNSDKPARLKKNTTIELEASLYQCSTIKLNTTFSDL